MEMTFYDDSHFRSVGKGDGKSLKRPVTLDLESPNTASKKQRFTAILTSPDLNMLKLASPELERLIIANGSLTTTPTPTQILFPKSVTEEQENYARGFIDALNHLHQTTSIDVNTTLFARNPESPNSGSKMYSGLVPIYLTTPTATSVIKSSSNAKCSVLTTLNPSSVRPPSVESTTSSSCNSSSLPTPLEIAIKEEYQTVPSDFSSPPISPINRTPIDMADQERIKLERKRYRNRLAASKCRRRKLEKISQLEDKVKDLKGENAKLEAFADRLREQVFSLKQTVLDHVRKGCQIMIHQNS